MISKISKRKYTFFLFFVLDLSEVELLRGLYLKWKPFF